ncbi:hypothetical protein T492DRAFT_1142062 [Pavlovales sp. CCMP2436]|nr:hypothetical protein T492DRAFT_1142062 [Pavlovales sp. CCMP2436]
MEDAPIPPIGSAGGGAASESEVVALPKSTPKLKARQTWPSALRPHSDALQEPMPRLKARQASCPSTLRPHSSTERGLGEGGGPASASRHASPIRPRSRSASPRVLPAAAELTPVAQPLDGGNDGSGVSGAPPGGAGATAPPPSPPPSPPQHASSSSCPSAVRPHSSAERGLGLGEGGGLASASRQASPIRPHSRSVSPRISPAAAELTPAAQPLDGGGGGGDGGDGGGASAPPGGAGATAPPPAPLQHSSSSSLWELMPLATNSGAGAGASSWAPSSWHIADCNGIINNK